MEIRQLRAFVAIAETHTFTAGAKQMHVTQAAISMQIRQLENELGLPVFTRTPRRVLLTEAGERLLERARIILREHDDAVAEVAEIGGIEHGRLRVGSASAEFTTIQLPPILAALKKIYNRADLSLVSGTSRTLVEKILNGEIDVAFVSLPVENAGISTELLFSDELVAIGFPDHPLAKKRTITLAELAADNLILGESGGNTRRLIDDLFDRHGIKTHIAMELTRQEAINQMVEAGLGIGTAGAKTIANEATSGKLITWQIDGADIRWQQGLARLRGGYFSPIAQEFVRLCKESFATRERSSKAGR